MKPAMISFMGLDGSGKSTSIDYAYEQLKNRGYKVEIVRAAYVIVVMRGIIKLGKKIHHAGYIAEDLRPRLKYPDKYLLILGLVGNIADACLYEPGLGMGKVIAAIHAADVLGVHPLQLVVVEYSRGLGKPLQ